MGQSNLIESISKMYENIKKNVHGVGGAGWGPAVQQLCSGQSSWPGSSQWQQLEQSSLC